MIKFIVKIFLCKIYGLHKWTCNQEKGILATPEQLKSEKGFWTYATMYCDRCGHISELSKNIIKKYE